MSDTKKRKTPFLLAWLPFVIASCSPTPLLSAESVDKSDEYFDGNVLENYRIYDASYDPETFSVQKIEALDGRDDFILGADISQYSAIYEAGAAYYDANGKKTHICEILRSSGVNLARIRLFHDYRSPYGVACGKLDLPRVISMISDCKQYGLKVLLDLHYSDTWADPSHQQIPYAWEGYTYDQVLEAFHDYTKNVLLAIQKQGLDIDYIQIGNEIDHGIIFPYGHIDWEDKAGSYDKMAEILGQGVSATKEVFPNCKIILHNANGLYRWVHEDQWGNVSMEFYEAMVERHLDYDIIGASFYTSINPDTPIEYISDIIELYGQQLHKPSMIVESAYAFTYAWNEYTNNTFYTDQELDEYPVSFQGQTNLIADLVEEVATAKNQWGVGYCYWGGEQIPNTDPDMRSAWANQALFTYEGIATPTLSSFRLL